MKYFILIIAMIVMIPSKAESSQKSSTFIVKDSIENVISNIVAYEDSCKKGCPNYIPSVKEIKIIKDFEYTKNSFYIWTFVKATLHSKYFSKVEITKRDGITFIKQRQLNKAEAKSLTKATGLTHKPLMKETISTYELFPNKDKVHISYLVEVSYEGILLSMASKKIANGLDKSIKFIQSNLVKSSTN